MSSETGFLLPGIHGPSNALLDQSTYRAETIKFALNADTGKTYSKLYNQPLYGLGVYSGTFYNKGIGDPLGVFVYIKTPILKKPSWSLFTEIGSGIAGNFNPYHKTLNPNNEMTGTRINMLGHLSIGVDYAIHKSFNLGINLGYKHFSNGFIKAPNFGINILPITITGSYAPPKSKPISDKHSIPPFITHNRYIVFVAPGSKSFGNEEKNYFVSTIGLQYIRQFSYKIGVGGGVDLFYKDSGKDKVKSNESDFEKSLSSGLNTSLEWIFTEKFRINAGVGIYLMRHKENDETSLYYERISGRYNLSKNIYAGVGVKINHNASDYIEWTLGYVFMKDQNKY